MKKITFHHKYRAYILLERLFRYLSVGVIISLISCATASTVPQQTYMNSQSLSGINKVAIIASVTSPKVSYAKNTTSYPPGIGLLFGPLGILLEAGISGAVVYGIDQGHAAKIGEHMKFSHTEEKMAQSFIQLLRKGCSFQTIEYLTDKNPDSKQLTTKGYDAVIKLLVQQISIDRDPGDSVRLSTHVSGQMEHLTSEKVIWDREENITNPEWHTLDYYKENGLKELDTMLEKAAKNLAYDFIYLK